MKKQSKNESATKLNTDATTTDATTTDVTTTDATTADATTADAITADAITADAITADATTADATTADTTTADTTTADTTTAEKNEGVLTEILSRLQSLEYENKTLKNRPTFDEMKRLESQKLIEIERRNKLQSCKEMIVEFTKSINSSDLFADSQDYAISFSIGIKQLFRINNNNVLFAIMNNTIMQIDSKLSEIDSFCSEIDNKLI